MATFVMNGCSFVQLSIWAASTCSLLAAVCDRAVATEVLLLKSGSSVVAALTGLPWLRGEFSCSKEEAAECTNAHAVANRSMRPTPMLQCTQVFATGHRHAVMTRWRTAASAGGCHALSPRHAQ